MSFLRKLVCVCTKLVCVCAPSLCIATCTATCSRPQQERQVHRRETRHHRTRHRGTRQLYTVPCARGPSKRPCRLVCFCALCAPPLACPRSHAPQQHEALVRSRSMLPSNTKPLCAPALMLPSNTKPLCPTLCSSAGRQRVRSRSHAPLACSRYLFAPPYVCFGTHLLLRERAESQ